MDTQKLKEYRVRSVDAKTTVGYTRIEIGNLKIKLTDRSREKLIEMLSDTYRPLIENKDIQLEIDGVTINPTPFPLDKNFVIEKFNFTIDQATLFNSRQETISGWIGRLGPRTGVKGGMRCYYKGRLICEREFFGHPDPTYRGTLNFLFGEVNLDFIPVNTNKTDFKRDSDEWSLVEEKMHEILHPHIDELLGRKIEEPTEEDINRIKKAKDLFQEILKLINQKVEGSNKSSDEDYDLGQKPSSSTPEKSKPEAESQPGTAKHQPRTPPPADHIGIRRRLRKFMEWEIRSMAENIRSKIEERDGGKVLVINNIFPGYIKSRGNDFYLLETAALQTVPIEETAINPKLYLEEFDRFFAKICEHMDVAQEFLAKKKRK